MQAALIPHDEYVRARAASAAKNFLVTMEAVFGPIFGQAREVLEEAIAKYPVRGNPPEESASSGTTALAKEIADRRAEVAELRLAVRLAIDLIEDGHVHTARALLEVQL